MAAAWSVKYIVDVLTSLEHTLYLHSLWFLGQMGSSRANSYKYLGTMEKPLKLKKVHIRH